MKKLKNSFPKLLGPIVVALITALVVNFVSSDARDQKPADDILDRPITTLRDFNNAFVDIAAKVRPAVVTVSTERIMRQQTFNPFGNDPFLQQFFGYNPHQQQQPQEKEYRQQGLGSGVIISSDGIIITNNHVVDGADSIYVQTNDGERLSASVIGTDKQTDIAVLKVNRDHLPYLQFGNSDELKVGEIVLAIGSPMSENLAYSVTQGIVSAKGRSNVGLAEYEDFIQTDAAINPGNSGGPLVNLNGELIGINTAILTRSGGNQGIGFAVPSKMAESVMSALVNDGKVTRGWLGVYIQDVNEDMAKAFNLRDNKGALVSEVQSGSPADDAGLMSGDVIIDVDGRAIDNSTELRSIIASAGPDRDVRLKVIREGSTKNLTVRLGELPDSAINTGSSTDLEESLGFSFNNLNRQTADQYNLDRSANGVVVTGIDQHSNAYRAGLREGDLIKSLNRSNIENRDDLIDMLKNFQKGDNLLLRITRDSRNLFIAFSL